MKRFISMLLSISMVLSLCGSSLSVSAVDVTSTTKTEGTGQVSTLFENELNEKMADLSNDYGITSVEVIDSTAVVKYHAVKDCTVIIGIYEDDGTNGTHMLSFKEAKLKAAETEAEIALANLPECFYLKAYLIDTETLHPVAKVYESPNYTKQMKDFFDRTVNDFPAERVWNLDDSDTTNFMVLAKGVKVVNMDNQIDFANISITRNSVSVSSGADADETLLDLEKGDPFMFFTKSGVVNGIVTKATISKDGSTAEIQYSEAQTGDLFEHIRIDTSNIVNNEQAAYGIRRVNSAPQIEPEVTPLSVSTSFSVGKEGSTQKDEDADGIAISGSVKATFGLAVEGEVKVYYSSDEEDEVDYVEVTCTPKITVSIEGEGSVTVNKTWIDQPVPIVPTGVPGVNIISVDLELSTSASTTITGKADVTFVVPGEITVKGDMYSNEKLTYDCEKVSPTTSAEAALTFAGTVSFTAKANICEVDLELFETFLASAGAELEIKEELKFYKDMSRDPDSPEYKYVKHSCKPLECISGSNSISVSGTVFCESPVLKLIPETELGELGGEAEIGNFTFDGSEGKISCELFTVELLPENMRDFYIRTNPLSYNYGKCSNKSYLTVFTVKDKYNDTIVEGAKVKWENEEAVTNDYGAASLFLPCGKSAEITVECDGYLPYTHTTKVISDYHMFEDINITYAKAVTAITPVPEETESPAVYVHGNDLRFTSLKVEYADGTSEMIPFYVDGKLNEEITLEGYKPHDLKTIQDVTITYKKAEYKLKIKIIADDRVVESIEAVPAVTEYYVGDYFFDSTDGKVIVHYTDGTVEEKALSYCKLSGFNSEKIGNVTMTAKFTDDHGNTVSDTFDIVINGPVALEWLDYPEKTVYNCGEDFDRTSGLMTLSYFNGKGDLIPLTDEKVTIEFDPEKLGEQTVKIRYADFDGYLTFTVTVTDKIKSCRIAGLAKTHYLVGEPLDLSDAVLEITYKEDVTSLIPITVDMVSGFDSSTLGECTLKVKYKDSVSGVDVEAETVIQIVDGSVMPCDLIVVPVNPNYYNDMSRYNGVEFDVEIIYTDYSTYDVGTIAVPTDDYYHYDENIGYIHITGYEISAYGLVQTINFEYEGVSATSYIMVTGEDNPKKNPVKDGYYGIGVNVEKHKDYKTKFAPGESFEITSGSKWAVVYWREDESGDLYYDMDVPDEALHDYNTSYVLNEIPSSPTVNGYSFKMLLAFNTEFGRKLIGIPVKVSGTGSTAAVSYSLVNDSGDVLTLEVEEDEPTDDDTVLNNTDNTNETESDSETEAENSTEDSDETESNTETETENSTENSDETESESDIENSDETTESDETVTETSEIDPVPVMTNNSELLKVLSQLKSADFTGLLTDEIYNYYVVKNTKAADIFSEDNLLFIGQAVSDSSGKLSVEYETTTGEDGEIILKPLSYIDLSTVVLDINVSDPVYNGKEQTVLPVIKLNGKLLEKDVDYVLSGDVTVKDVGKYTITVKGIGDYTGTVEISYEVKNSSSGGTANPPSGGNTGNNGNNPSNPVIPSTSTKTWTVIVKNLVTGKTTSANAKRDGNDVVINLGSKNNDYYANAYSADGEFLDGVLIKNGTAKFINLEENNFRIEIDSVPHFDDVSSDAGFYVDEYVTEVTQNKPYAVIILVIAVTGVCVIEWKKKKDRKSNNSCRF